jgi:hypothetical protein
MIKHIVLVQFSDEVSTAQREAIYESVENLKQYVTGWEGFVAGENVTPEVGMDKGYNGGFVIDFADEAARDAYLVHPEHQKVGGTIVASAVNGIEGIMVFDLAV